MNSREFEMKAISNEFAHWEIKISNLSSLNLFDANIFSEHSICELLNCIYEYKLHNINALQKNFPSIDLGDNYNRICFQVTSTKSSKKIQSTIDKFLENKLYNDYDELYILVLGKKQKNYPEFSVSDELDFNEDRNIIDFRDLLSFINSLSTAKIKRISKLLNEENRAANKIAPKRNNSSIVKRNLTLKKRIKKDLLIKLKHEEWEYARYEPWIKFKYRNILVRSVDDKSFPEVDDRPNGEMSSWFKGETWDFYENGIELISWGGEAIFDKNGNWDILKNGYDKRKNNSNYEVIPFHTFLRIPYDFIVDYDMEPDAYYSIPSIYVEYLKNGMPYEEILYGQMGTYDLKQYTRIFDNEDRRKLD
ncbi:hypothetical protein GCM10023188_47830 [Pontibacter saemangeumensis]|uniref:SMEK domain-containing protein n=1 Tax=Pontibacter saemangeumensis TaxID=1084525 RepID=A0ABP8M9B6_9BACT